VRIGDSSARLLGSREQARPGWCGGSRCHAHCAYCHNCQRDQGPVNDAPECDGPPTHAIASPAPLDAFSARYVKSAPAITSRGSVATNARSRWRRLGRKPQTSMSLRPTGLADGLAPHKQRYPRTSAGFAPGQLGSPAPRLLTGDSACALQAIMQIGAENRVPCVATFHKRRILRAFWGADCDKRAVAEGRTPRLSMPSRSSLRPEYNRPKGCKVIRSGR
jgi:hypothetical protein